VLAVAKFVQGMAAKKNSGGDINTQLALIEAKLGTMADDIKEVSESLQEISDRFFQFREEMRLHMTREQVLREVRKNESTG
jgi:hypothetical protein